MLKPTGKRCSEQDEMDDDEYHDWCMETTPISRTVRKAKKAYECDAWQTLESRAEHEGVRVKKCAKIKPGDEYEDESVVTIGEGFGRLRSCMQCVSQLRDEKLWRRM